MPTLDRIGRTADQGFQHTPPGSCPIERAHWVKLRISEKLCARAVPTTTRRRPRCEITRPSVPRTASA